MTVDIDQRNAHWSARRRPVRSLEPIDGVPMERRFPRFADAMTAARAANAPQLALHRDALTQDIPPAVGRGAPKPRAAQWRAARAPRRPVARWLGIGVVVVLVGSWLASVPMSPIGAEIERLIGPWLDWQKDWAEWRQDREAVLAPPVDRAPPTALAPAAGRDDPQQGPMPQLARDGFEAMAEPGWAAPPDVVAAPVSEEPAARAVPVPALKPSLKGQ